MDADSVLIRKMKHGDTQAVDEFVRKYYDRILQYFRFRVGGYEIAQDLTQETFEKYFRAFGEYKHYGKAANYLYVIAGNISKDFYKKEYIRREREVFDEALESEDFVNKNEIRLEEQVLQTLTITNAIKALPVEISEVAYLYFCQEFSLKEVSVILEISLPLVKYRVRMAREQLKKFLREEEAL